MRVWVGVGVEVGLRLVWVRFINQEECMAECGKPEVVTVGGLGSNLAQGK